MRENETIQGPPVMEIAGGKKRRGGGPKTNVSVALGLYFLVLIIYSLWEMGNKGYEDPSDASYLHVMPYFDYVKGTIVAIWTAYFTTAFIGQLNFFHTIGSKLSAYAIAIDKARTENKQLKPEDVFSLFNMYPLLKGLIYGKNVAEIEQSLDTNSFYGPEVSKTRRIRLDQPNVSWVNNEIVINKCPTTISFKGGRRKTRRVKYFCQT